VLSLGLVLLLYAIVFLSMSPLVLAQEVARGQRPVTTPFATAEPPPQILPPMEPD
jgi:hypothetical protein